MKLRKDVEVDITIEEAFEAAMESCALDRLALINKLSRTISEKEMTEIVDLTGKDMLRLACNPIVKLSSIIGAING